MGFYTRHIVPRLVHTAMKSEHLERYRQRAVAEAHGRVLELGVGSGMNLPLYDPHRVDQVVGLDPSRELLDKASERAARAEVDVELVEGSAEALPFADDSFEVVLSTWTMCSIDDLAAALAEARRVLVPDGRLVFTEHGAADDTAVRRWQDRLTPLWKRVAGGCRLNRSVGRMIERAGFDIETLDTGYGHGPRIAAWMFEGVARPAEHPR